MEAGTCGWRLGESVEGSHSIGRAEAGSAPGPSVDAVPGSPQGIIYTRLAGGAGHGWPHTLDSAVKIFTACRQRPSTVEIHRGGGI